MFGKVSLVQWRAKRAGKRRIHQKNKEQFCGARRMLQIKHFLVFLHRICIGEFKESLITRQPPTRLTSKYWHWRDLLILNLHAKYQLSTCHRLRFYSRTDRQTYTRFSDMAADFQDVPRQKLFQINKLK